MDKPACWSSACLARAFWRRGVVVMDLPFRVGFEVVTVRHRPMRYFAYGKYCTLRKLRVAVTVAGNRLQGSYRTNLLAVRSSRASIAIYVQRARCCWD